MKFINDIGGKQLRWPDSEVYGPRYFDPPVVINGLAEVERLTWIRGADRVTIGPKETVVEWRAFRGLVIPRLRVSEIKPIEAVLQVENAVVEVDPPLVIDVAQLADGRPIGGVRVVKRHPEWKEPHDKRPHYRLWLRVVDFDTGQPLKETKVALFRWKNAGRGEFVLLEEAPTDGTGSVVRDPRAPDVLEAATLAMDGWRATAKVWRAQPNEPVSLLMTAAKLKSAKYPAQVPGSSRPIYGAVYTLDAGDTLEWVARTFRYKDVQELADMNRVPVEQLGSRMPLPGWYFVHAQAGETLDSVAAAFKLKPGWPRTVGRHHRPHPSVAIAHEIVAIPAPDFAAGRAPA
jgi:LysM repeat protein